MSDSGEKPKRQLLAIFAHSDDESCGPGATLARYAAKGVAVTVVCVTRGEWGGYGEWRKLPPWQMAALRASELFAACHALGVTRCILLGHEDGSLERLPAADLESELAELICQINPYVLITHSHEGPSGHSDHNMLSSIAPTALKKALKACYELPPKCDVCKPNMFRLFGAIQSCCGSPVKQRDASLVGIDAGPYVPKKLEALKHHVSQEHCWRPMLSGGFRGGLTKEWVRFIWSREPVSKPLRGDLFEGLPAA